MKSEAESTIIQALTHQEKVIQVSSCNIFTTKKDFTTEKSIQPDDMVKKKNSLLDNNKVYTPKPPALLSASTDPKPLFITDGKACLSNKNTYIFSDIIKSFITFIIYS